MMSLNHNLIAPVFLINIKKTRASKRTRASASRIDISSQLQNLVKLKLNQIQNQIQIQTKSHRMRGIERKLILILIHLRVLHLPHITTIAATLFIKLLITKKKNRTRKKSEDHRRESTVHHRLRREKTTARFRENRDVETLRELETVILCDSGSEVRPSDQYTCHHYNHDRMAVITLCTVHKNTLMAKAVCRSYTMEIV
ncbi:unnamed protein product [Trifolium pratense]|uniref:Uncharacterized protein n=1 Tax=Trifolium pratense TaxID=57577 RepID=A0ACB0JIL9_TRIPR|nr:unnamed protein product [Trifolium pratense]